MVKDERSDFFYHDQQSDLPSLPTSPRSLLRSTAYDTETHCIHPISLGLFPFSFRVLTRSAQESSATTMRHFCGTPHKNSWSLVHLLPRLVARDKNKKKLKGKNERPRGCQEVPGKLFKFLGFNWQHFTFPLGPISLLTFSENAGCSPVQRTVK